MDIERERARIIRERDFGTYTAEDVARIKRAAERWAAGQERREIAQAADERRKKAAKRRLPLDKGLDIPLE